MPSLVTWQFSLWPQWACTVLGCPWAQLEGMLAWADCVTLLARAGPVCCQGHSSWQLGTRQAALPRPQLTHRFSRVAHAEDIGFYAIHAAG